jgi:hypothetical protein
MFPLMAIVEVHVVGRNEMAGWSLEMDMALGDKLLDAGRIVEMTP